MFVVRMASSMQIFTSLQRLDSHLRDEEFRQNAKFNAIAVLY